MRPRPGYDFCEFLPAFLDFLEHESRTADSYNFGIGDIRGVPGYEEILRSVLQKVSSQVADYLVRLPGQQGFGPLCELLARIHSSVSGEEFVKDDILLTEGGCSGISIALSAIQGPGAKVAYAVPSFPYWCTLDSIGLRSVPLLFRDPHEYAATYGLQLRRAVEKDREIRAIILDEPQNPMGFALDASQLKLIGELADEHDLQVVVDDVAMTFAFQTEEWWGRYTPEEHRYLVGSFTKQFAVPGLRLGWLIPPRTGLAAVRSVVANLRAGVGNFAALFGYELIRCLQECGQSDMIDREIRRRAAETSHLEEEDIPGVRFWVPRQGLYSLGKVDSGLFPSSSSFVEHLAAEGIRLMDYRFLFPPSVRDKDLKMFMRLSVGGEARVKEGVKTLIARLSADSAGD